MLVLLIIFIQQRMQIILN